MNIENLRLIRNVIAILPPERFNMATFGQRGWEVISEPEILREDCKTAACICGWTNALITQAEVDDQQAAAEALGLDMETAMELFMPQQNLEGITNAEAVRVIDHLIETGEVCW